MVDFDEMLKSNKCVRLFMKTPAIFTFGLICAMNTAFFLVCLKGISKHISIITEILLIIINETLFFMISWALFRTVMNDPGYVPENLKIERSELFIQTKQEYEQKILIQNDIDIKNRKSKSSEINASSISTDLESCSLVKDEDNNLIDEGEYKSKKEKYDGRQNNIMKFRYCRKCDNLKPPRSEHCSLCGVCVLRMDHHCPWFANCIAFNTQKNFMLFLFYTALGCLANCICYCYGWSISFSCYGSMPKDFIAILALLGTVMTAMGCLSCLILTSFMLFLTIKNKLSGGVMFDSKSSPNNAFSKSILENIKEVVGDNLWRWWIPEKDIQRTCNGIDY